MAEAGGHLLFVGQAALDHVFRVDRFSSQGDKRAASAYACRIGGMATNAARAAHRLRDGERSPQVRLVSAVGHDAAGVELRRLLGEEGLDTRGVVTVQGACSTVSAVLVDAAGERQVHNVRGDALSRAVLPTTSLFDGCVGVLADPRWPQAAALAFAAAQRLGLPSVFDADVAEPEVLRALAPQASWCVFSRDGLAAWLSADEADRGPAARLDTDEVTAVARQAAAAEGFRPGAALVAVAARWIAASSRAQLVVTLGADGALWRRPDGSEAALPAFRVDVQDSTGAGDVMHGALLLALAERRPPEDALRFAMAAAALACCGSWPVRSELEHFLETHR